MPKLERTFTASRLAMLFDQERERMVREWLARMPWHQRLYVNAKSLSIALPVVLWQTALRFGGY